jgi:hypothetical protein
MTTKSRTALGGCLPICRWDDLINVEAHASVALNFQAIIMAPFDDSPHEAFGDALHVKPLVHTLSPLLFSRCFSLQTRDVLEGKFDVARKRAIVGLRKFFEHHLEPRRYVEPKRGAARVFAYRSSAHHVCGLPSDVS